MAIKSPQKLQDSALAFTRWVGSTQSIIVHTIVFATSFIAAYLNILSFDRMLLVLTTLVSLEAIYLAIFIQMSINSTKEDIAGVEQNLDEIQEDVGEIQEDIDEIQEDVGEIQEDVDDLQEDVEEMSEEDVAEMNASDAQDATLKEISEGLKKLMNDVERLKQSR